MICGCGCGSTARLRQDVLVDGDMIYPPVQALQALSRFQRLDAGDLVLTGTPVGTAISAPPKPVADHRLPAARGRSSGSLLLRPGQNPNICATATSSSRVATDDGAIDLGAQRTVVRFA